MDLAFLLCSLVTIVCAAMVVTRRNPIYGALYLMGFFLGITGLFVLLAAPFVAVLQVVVYVGAILVLFLFVIMLFDHEGLEREPRRSILSQVASLLLAAGLFVGLAAIFFRARGLERSGPEALRDESFGSIETLAEHLMLRYPLAIEAVSLLIVAALVGAVVLSRPVGRVAR